MNKSLNLKVVAATVFSAALAGAALIPMAAYAQSGITDASVASGMSVALPVALSVTAPAALLAGASHLTVSAVRLTADGTIWIIENTVNGVSTTIQFAGNTVHAMGVGAGMVLSTATVAAGVLLYDGSRAIALIPNELGSALMHHEQLSW